METSNFKKRTQILLAIGLVAVGIRTLLIFRERHATAPQPQPQNTALDADDYVVAQKLHAYDLKSARQGLKNTPVWVRAGYGLAYYPYNAATKRADFSHQAGLLAPIEQLQVTDLVLNRAPGSGGGEWQGPPDARFRVHSDQQQVIAVFSKDGKQFAFPAGTVSNGDYHFFLDDLLFIQDPHQLYKHWPAQTWQAIAQHEAKPGMNQLQVSFAIGVPDGASDPTDQQNTTYHYPDNGHPLSVTFENGKATRITPEQPAAKISDKQ